MKPLFNDDETWNKDSKQFSDKIDVFMREIFKECLEKGYSTNDLLTIIIENASINKTFITAKYFLMKRISSRPR